MRTGETVAHDNCRVLVLAWKDKRLVNAVWNWWKRSWSYTWQCIIAKCLCMAGRHAIGQKSSRTFSRRKISNCWNGRERAWTLMQLRISGQNWRKVAKKHPTSLSSLIKTIKSSWVLDMLTELCWNLMESMPRRIREVLEAKRDIQSTECLNF